MSTISAVRGRQLIRERIAASAIFVSFGLVLGTWAAHLSSVKQAIGASTSSMGTILLILGAAALAGMQWTGYAVDKFGSGRITTIGATLMALALVPPLVLSTWLTVAFAALLLGVATGISEVGINAAAVEIERDYRRPIMASFHGMFSLGTVVGALLGALASTIGLSVQANAVVLMLIAVSVNTVAGFTLWSRSTSVEVRASRREVPGIGHAKAGPPLGRLILLGVLAFLLLLTEGSAMDWSSLHAQQHLGASSTGGAVVLASFVSAMTVGRFTVDRVTAKTGPVRVVRWGCLIAVVGLTIVMQAATLTFTCSGWILLGLGLSGCVPQVFTATGRLPGADAKALSRVVGAGYLAVLAGPRSRRLVSRAADAQWGSSCTNMRNGDLRTCSESYRHPRQCTQEG